MTDDDVDPESDSGPKDTVSSIDRKARVADTPDEDPRGGRDGGGGESSSRDEGGE